ncbi:MAG: PQQ-binding-like beta-propeller repeat protein, partial [Planctomycetota bacterium]
QEYLRQNQPKRRIKILERILALSGENQLVRKNLAELLARELQIEKACTHYDVLIDNERQNGHEDAAMELCRHILALSPKHGKAHEQLAAIYAKKGQKGEAFIHYRELFETLREQNRSQEARVAGLLALDCDPTRTDLRNNLIDLLIADQQKDLVAQQIELLGDQAVKVGNSKLAADSYRRAMQFKLNSKHLKKKLANVMLTKEDRRARKRRMIGIVVSIILAMLMISGVFLFEHINSAKWEEVEREAQPLLSMASEDLKAERFSEAIEKLQCSNILLRPWANLFSPIKRYNQLARNLINEGNRGIQEAEHKIAERTEKEEQRSRMNLNAAQLALKALRIYDARKNFERMLENTFSSEEQKLAAKTGSEEARRLITQLEEGARKLQQNPNTEWATIEEEIAWKKAYVETFKANPELLDMNKITMPFHIQPEINSANVFLDGRPWGTVKKTGKPFDNIVRYPFLGSHRLEFKTVGYKSVTINISEQSVPTCVLKPERAPSVRIDLDLPGGVTLTGDVASDGEIFYVGTSEGSLLQVSNQPVPILRRHDLTDTGLNREVYGSPFILKDTPKGDLIIYCTKAGDCFGLLSAENGFKKIWSVKGDPSNPLTAKPVILKPALLGGRAVCALPTNRRLTLIECETGAAACSLNVQQTVTASPLLIENRTIIVVGCGDGNLYGITLANDTVRQWSSNAQAAVIRGRPVLIPFEDSLVAGADDGTLYFFNAKALSKSYKIGEVKLKGAIVSEPLLLKKHIYVGATLTQREGFWSIDLSRRKEQWHSQDLEGGVSTSPVALEKCLYFVTNSGRLYALNSEKGAIRWVYQLDAASKGFFCSPLIVNRRIYVFSASGRILGFDELPDE